MSRVPTQFDTPALREEDVSGLDVPVDVTEAVQVDQAQKTRLADGSNLVFKQRLLVNCLLVMDLLHY